MVALCHWVSLPCQCSLSFFPSSDNNSIVLCYFRCLSYPSILICFGGWTALLLLLFSLKAFSYIFQCKREMISSPITIYTQRSFLTFLFSSRYCWKGCSENNACYMRNLLSYLPFPYLNGNMAYDSSVLTYCSCCTSFNFCKVHHFSFYPKWCQSFFTLLHALLLVRAFAIFISSTLTDASVVCYLFPYYVL